MGFLYGFVRPMLKCPYCEKAVDLDVGVCPSCRARLEPTNALNTAALSPALFVLNFLLWNLSAYGSFLLAFRYADDTTLLALIASNIIYLAFSMVFAAKRKTAASILFAFAPAPISLGAVTLVHYLAEVLRYAA
jgi:hypothetical protein